MKGLFDVRQSGDPDSSAAYSVVAFNQKRIHRQPNNNYNVDTKPLRLYKKIEATTWGKCKVFFKSYADFLNERRGYILAAGLIWSYNLNAVTIVMEFVAFVFYFAVSFDVLGIFTQIAKLAMDLTVAINFLPWFVWVVVGFLIFDAIRKNIGTQRLRGYEARTVIFWKRTRARCSWWGNSVRKRRPQSRAWHGTFTGRHISERRRERSCGNGIYNFRFSLG